MPFNPPEPLADLAAFVKVGSFISSHHYLQHNLDLEQGGGGVVNGEPIDSTRDAYMQVCAELLLSVLESVLPSEGKGMSEVWPRLIKEALAKNSTPLHVYVARFQDAVRNGLKPGLRHAIYGSEGRGLIVSVRWVI